MKNSVRSHKDLEIWKRSIQMVTEIYDLTRDFPDNEKYGLVNQIRRASVSVPSNIAEGAARKSKKEFANFLYISIGSLAEIETQLIISKNLKYAKNIDPILLELKSILFMIRALAHKISTPNTKSRSHEVTKSRSNSVTQ